jgi:hypothetical protein
MLDNGFAANDAASAMSGVESCAGELRVRRTRILDARVVNSPRSVVLAVSAIIVALEGCARHRASDFWVLGTHYNLVLHLSEKPTLTPERAAYFAPVVDSVVLLLQLDSVREDRAFGTYRGDFRHFPVAYASIGDSTFVSSRSSEHWQVTLSGAATDAGLTLEGEHSQGKLRGTWQVRSSNSPHGEFTIVPGA